MAQKQPHMAQHGPTLPNMLQNYPTWPKFALHGQTLPNMAQHFPPWSKITQHGRKWPKCDPNPIVSKLVAPHLKSSFFDMIHSGPYWPTLRRTAENKSVKRSPLLFSKTQFRPIGWNCVFGPVGTSRAKYCWASLPYLARRSERLNMGNIFSHCVHPKSNLE